MMETILFGFLFGIGFSLGGLVISIAIAGLGLVVVAGAWLWQSYS